MTERVGDEIRGVCHGGRAVMGRQIAVGLGYFILSTVSGALPESSFSFLSHLWSSGDIQGLEVLCGKEVRISDNSSLLSEMLGNIIKCH